MISASVVADSMGPSGTRITSVKITAHRFILAEINTHRVFSRNFRSSRAVPVRRLLEEVRNAPALPCRWQSNKAGMQGGDELTGQTRALVEDEWRSAAMSAADHAERLMEAGLHKGWSNRLLEPFLYVHGIITSTEWDNFFALRRHADAQPEFKALADAIFDAMSGSIPTMINSFEWHLPFLTAEHSLAYRFTREHQARLVSAARCARVSYLSHEGKNTSVEEDLKLAQSLLASRHMSPFEHQARPDVLIGTPEQIALGKGHWSQKHHHRNFVGWVQHRAILEQ